MAIINQSNILNLQPGITAPVVVHMSEGDVGTKLSFKLIDGARAWTDPGNVVAAVHGRRQDGTQFGPYACTISGDVVSFQTDAAIAAAAGSGIAQIVLTDGNGNTAGSANFAIMVERATFPHGVTYRNDVSVYEAILAYAQNVPAAIVENFNKKITREANAREEADAAIIARTTSLQEGLTAEISDRTAQDATLSARMDEFTKLPDGSLSTAADAELADIRVMVTGETAATAGDAVREQITGLNDDLAEANGLLDTEEVEPLNKIDLSKITAGYHYNWQGNLTEDATKNTTDYIPVKQGDVLWMFNTNASGINLVSANADRLIECDASKTRLLTSGQYPFAVTQTQGGNVYAYTVQSENAAYVRVSYNASYTYPSLYVNADPTKTYTLYVPYTAPYKISKRLAEIEDELAAIGKGYDHFIDGYYVNTKRQSFDIQQTGIIPPSVTDITIKTVTSYQGFAYCNGVIFQLYSNDVVVLIDATTGQKIAELEIKSDHGDTIDFSDEYYSPLDEFPLAYVSSDTTPAKVYVVRISREQTELIRTYLFDDVTKIGYYAGHTLDSKNNILYQIGYTNNSYLVDDGTNKMIVSKWDLSETVDNGDGTLTPKFISAITVPFIKTAQGQAWFDDKIWVVSSTFDGHDTQIYIISPATGISAIISDLPDTIKNPEVEGIAFVPTGNVYAAFLKTNANNVGYFKMVFSN